MSSAPIPPSLRPPADRADPARGAKRRPHARLRALDDPAGPAVADWASLFGDLARPPPLTTQDPVEWRLHDRTHLEFAIDYPLDDEDVQYTWEAYFFVPESFRLDEQTYDKKDIYDDLWSYVRYAVPDIPFYELAGRGEKAPLSRLSRTLDAAVGKPNGSPEANEAVRQARLFACLVRASGVVAMREIERQIASHNAELGGIVATFVSTCGAVARDFRSAIERAEKATVADDVRIALRWADEDVSLMLETLTASLGIALDGESPALRDIGEKLAAFAVAEARHRKARGYDALGKADASEREIEHLEFRRHVLKRFTSSVLWLRLEVRDAAIWILHTFYALAAGVAMAFGLAASLHATQTTENFFRYALVVVIAYAARDRMKAVLQHVFAGFIAKRFPDRRWRIRDVGLSRPIGKVHERAAFLPFRSLPDAVLAKRRLTREHALEEDARPERVLWHEKSIALSKKDAARPGFSMLTEIFRLNLRRWLDNTDDPNRKIVFADPSDARVYSATARRVYNINVVYRLRKGSEAPMWHRLRVVVSRKGIERIEPIC